MLKIVKEGMVVALAIIVVVVAAQVAFAHEITIKGTVAAIEAKRLQVTTGEEKKGQAAGWYAIDAKTKVMRGKATVTLAQAKVVVGEKVVVLVDHDSDAVMKALEIRLAAQ